MKISHHVITKGNNLGSDDTTSPCHRIVRRKLEGSNAAMRIVHRRIAKEFSKIYDVTMSLVS